ncbi:MAG: hypothetical protein ACU836_06320 [Gammaproteobacteria bacterium]
MQNGIFQYSDRRLVTTFSIHGTGSIAQKVVERLFREAIKYLKQSAMAKAIIEELQAYSKITNVRFDRGLKD